MKSAHRVILAVCTLATLFFLVLGFTPFRKAPLERDAPPGVEQVDCGSVFIKSEWSGDEACANEITGRVAVMFLVVFLVVALGLVLVLMRVVGHLRRLRR